MAKGSAFTRGMAAALGVGAAGAGAVIAARAYRAGAGTPVGDYGAALYPGVIGAEHAQGAADQLSELIAFRTVFSRFRDRIELEQFTDFIDALERLYPRVHASLSRELVNGHALLFRWAGTRPDAGSRPTVLMAHYDVVPAETGEKWTHPGFSGWQDGEFVWGRGALDNKGAVVLVMAAVESLITDGFAPAHDLYLFCGNDEEAAGHSARAAVELLGQRGVQPWLVLDEGGAVVPDAFPGVNAPVAVIGVAEKGVVDVELLTRSAGGHASTPPRMGATARLAQAIMALEDAPQPASMPEPIAEMLRRMGMRGGFALRLATANMWAFKPLLTVAMGLVGDETRALTRTTLAVTMLQGSTSPHVLAATARANVNIRIAVGESVDQVVARMRTIIDDPHVQLTVRSGHDPSPLSASNNDQFALLSRAVAASYPQAMVTPYIQSSATDSRFFAAICPAVYRFSPLLMDAEDRAGVHAVDEKVRISSLGAGVVFYRELLQGLG